MEIKMIRNIRWMSMAAAMAVIASAHGQFDFGGGQTNDRPWTEKQFKLNSKTRVKLDFRNSSADAVIAFYEKVSGITIIKDPALSGVLPLTSARPVPLDDAFQILSTTLSLKGYSISAKGNLLVIKGTGQAPGGARTGGFPGGGFDLGNGGFTGGDDRNTLRVYVLKYASSSQLARVLNDVYQQTPGFQFGGGGNNQFRGGGGPGGGGNNQFRGGQGGGQNFAAFARFGQQQQPNIRASSDDYSNSVIVNAPERNQAEVGSLISKLDIQTDDPQHSKVYKLTYAAAADMATVVQNVLTANVPRGKGGATTQQTTGAQGFISALRGTTPGSGQVATDTRTNSIVVTATDNNLTIVDKVVQDLDKDTPIQATTFVFPLMNARSDSIATLLQAALGNRQGVTAPNTTTLANASSTVGASQGNSTQTRTQTTTNGSRTGTGTGLGGSLPYDPSENMASIPGTSAMDQILSQPTAAQQQAMIQQGQTSLPIQLQDPNAQSGELLTSVGVTQGFGGGLFGGGGQRPGGTGSSQTSGTTYTQGHDPTTGQLTNIRDLTNQVTIIPDINTNSVVVVTNPEYAAIVAKILQQLDKVPQQVMIETILVEATLGDTDQLGLEWTVNSVNGYNSAKGGTNFGLQSASPPLQGLGVALSTKSYSAFLSALNTNTKFNVLATPRIFTTNNVSATINVSQSLPYITATIASDTGSVTNSYSFLTVGTVLTVQPRIMSSGEVTLDIDQQANDLQGYTSFNAPIVNQREATTTVSVKDGSTIILGGIIQKQVSSTVNKVPLLGDIPLLGKLFQSTNKSVTKTELLVFMTPHIIKGPEDAEKVKNDTVHEMSPETQKSLRDLNKPGLIPPPPTKPNGGKS